MGNGVRRYRDLIAWQLADEFRQEVFRLVRASPVAWADLRYKGQLVDAATSVPTNIAEGFLRCSPEIRRFLDFSLGSLAEAETRLTAGVDLGYFEKKDCEHAQRLARRCLVATIRLKQSQRQPPKKR